MSVIKQTSAIKGVTSTYRIGRLDKQTPKPYPIWKYTWILPEGVDAEFKSQSTGYPMVLVQWNETSPLGSPFILKCQVETDANDINGNPCIITTTINVAVDQNIVNLDTIIYGATGQCVQVGDETVDTDSTYFAKCFGANKIVWNVVNGKIRSTYVDELVYSPYSSAASLDGISSININWFDGSTHNVSAYGVDNSGNVSPQAILPIYPMGIIKTSYSGLDVRSVGDGDTLVSFSVTNIKDFDPTFDIIYHLYVGVWDGTGSLGSDSSFEWTHEILTENDLKIGDISTNIYTKNYVLHDLLTPTTYKVKFKPTIISSLGYQCYTETLDVKYLVYRVNAYVPVFVNTPEDVINVTYLPIFASDPTSTIDRTYTPTFKNYPTYWSATGYAYVPVFVNNPSDQIGVTYQPQFRYGVTGSFTLSYTPIFNQTGPLHTKDITYTPVFIHTPQIQISYVPTFVQGPSGTKVITYIPVFDNSPTGNISIEYTPVFRHNPSGYYQNPYTPTFNVHPTGNIVVNYTPVFGPTSPIDTKTIEYVPVFKTGPNYFIQVPYTPTFNVKPIDGINVQFVPVFGPTAPKDIKTMEYVPVFKLPPQDNWS